MAQLTPEGKAPKPAPEAKTFAGMPSLQHIRHQYPELGVFKDAELRQVAAIYQQASTHPELLQSPLSAKLFTHFDRVLYAPLANKNSTKQDLIQQLTHLKQTYRDYYERLYRYQLAASLVSVAPTQPELKRTFAITAAIHTYLHYRLQQLAHDKIACSSHDFYRQQAVRAIEGVRFGNMMEWEDWNQRINAAIRTTAIMTRPYDPETLDDTHFITGRLPADYHRRNQLHTDDQLTQVLIETLKLGPIASYHFYPYLKFRINTHPDMVAKRLHTLEYELLDSPYPHQQTQTPLTTACHQHFLSTPDLSVRGFIKLFLSGKIQLYDDQTPLRFQPTAKTLARQLIQLSQPQAGTETKIATTEDREQQLTTFISKIDQPDSEATLCQQLRAMQPDGHSLVEIMQMTNQSLLTALRTDTPLFLKTQVNGTWQAQGLAGQPPDCFQIAITREPTAAGSEFKIEAKQTFESLVQAGHPGVPVPPRLYRPIGEPAVVEAPSDQVKNAVQRRFGPGQPNRIQMPVVCVGYVTKLTASGHMPRGQYLFGLPKQKSVLRIDRAFCRGLFHSGNNLNTTVEWFTQLAEIYADPTYQQLAPPGRPITVNRATHTSTLRDLFQRVGAKGHHGVVSCDDLMQICEGMQRWCERIIRRHETTLHPGVAQRLRSTCADMINDFTQHGHPTDATLVETFKQSLGALVADHEHIDFFELTAGPPPAFVNANAEQEARYLHQAAAFLAAKDFAPPTWAKKIPAISQAWRRFAALDPNTAKDNPDYPLLLSQLKQIIQQHPEFAIPDYARLEKLNLLFADHYAQAPWYQALSARRSAHRQRREQYLQLLQAQPEQDTLALQLGLFRHLPARAVLNHARDIEKKSAQLAKEAQQQHEQWQARVAAKDRTKKNHQAAKIRFQTTYWQPLKTAIIAHPPSQDGVACQIESNPETLSFAYAGPANRVTFTAYPRHQYLETTLPDHVEPKLLDYIFTQLQALRDPDLHEDTLELQGSGQVLQLMIIAARRHGFKVMFSPMTQMMLRRPMLAQFKQLATAPDALIEQQWQQIKPPTRN